MTYRGRIKNGVAVLDDPVALPEGTRVRVEVENGDASYWNSKSVDELAKEQGTARLNSPDELAGEWPAEDSVDEFLRFIRGARR